MDSSQLVQSFGAITVWKKGDQRAPHKPLLVLYMLGRLSRGESGPVSFDTIDQGVGQLLDEFGPSRRTHARLPFWYLQNDGLWQLTNISRDPDLPLGSPPSKTTLRGQGVSGRFPEELERALVSNPDLIRQVAQQMLADNFPETIHEDILQAVGLDLTLPASPIQAASAGTRTPRNPAFRERVLQAYEYRCAVCGFDVRLGNAPIALEAAHIKWHQAGGPDEEPNGLALCSLHHKLFDRGAFSLDEDLRLLVSESAHGSGGFDHWLMQFHGKRIQRPQRTRYMPDHEYRAWHVREVFHGAAREFMI